MESVIARTPEQIVYLLYLDFYRYGNVSNKTHSNIYNNAKHFDTRKQQFSSIVQFFR